MSVYLSGQTDPAAVTAALNRDVIHVSLLLELQFATGTAYLSNRSVSFIDGKWNLTWQGLGNLVAASAVSSGDDTLAPSMSYTLGIPWEAMTAEQRAMQGLGIIPQLIGNPAEYVNRSAVLWEQVFSETARDEYGRPQPVGDPVALHRGVMDTVSVSFDVSAAVLTLTVEGALARAGAPVFGRLTHRDQLRRYPGDRGLRYVPEVMSTDPVWTEW